MKDEKDILDLDLTDAQAAQLQEALRGWKEDIYQTFEENAEIKIQEAIEKIEQENEVWKEETAEKYADKFFDLLEDISGEVKASVVAESVATDPVHQIMNEVMKLVAPLTNEEFVENVYLSELKTLREQVSKFEEEKALAEGRETLEALIEGYSDDLKPALRGLIGEGTSEEVEEKFYTIVESINEEDETEDEDYFLEDEDFDFDLDEDEDDDGDSMFEEFDFEDIEEEFNELDFNKDLNEDTHVKRGSSLLDLI